jgi:cob(I)alamin adenosyltransferase
MSRERDEPVRLNRIYTKGGDTGETSLGDGSRVSKLDALIQAAGAVDELNSVLGWAQVAVQDPQLTRIQNELFDVGADIAVPYVVGDGRLRIVQADVDRLEAACDELNATLPELRSFVLPGGTESAARLHMARTSCRMAERVVVAAAAIKSLNPLVAIYLNRLSDLLFILARRANGDAEILWRPGGER